VPAEDVDRTPFTGDLECHLGRRDPAAYPEHAENSLDELCVVSVEEAVELLAVPEDADPDSGVELRQDPFEGGERDSVRVAALDPADLRIGYADAPRQLPLRPAPLASKRTNLKTNSDRVHGRAG